MAKAKYVYGNKETIIENLKHFNVDDMMLPGGMKIELDAPQEIFKNLILSETGLSEVGFNALTNPESIAKYKRVIDAIDNGLPAVIEFIVAAVDLVTEIKADLVDDIAAKAKADEEALRKATTEEAISKLVHEKYDIEKKLFEEERKHMADIIELQELFNAKYDEAKNDQETINELEHLISKISEAKSDCEEKLEAINKDIAEMDEKEA